MRCNVAALCCIQPFEIAVTEEATYMFAGIDSPFTAARYHSLYGVRESLPDCLRVTAEIAPEAGGIVMGIEHKTLPVAAVQFHPESILTAHATGVRILTNCIEHFRSMGVL